MRFNGTNTVLVVGAHPDDEVLGAGGTIAKHAHSGDEVHTLILTEGTTQQYDDRTIIEEKKEQVKDCTNRLGVKKTYFGDLPDMRLDDVPHVDINGVIESVCEKVKPDIVYTHSEREVNQDHIETFDSTLVATRPKSGVSAILSYETPSSTNYSPSLEGFEPDLFVDISSHIEDKISAFKSYQTEVREFPHPRSPKALRALARTRGTAADMEMAEAFDILRLYN